MLFTSTPIAAQVKFYAYAACILGEVGPPLPCNMIKLVDVPEMNYFAANNCGEVCGLGPNVFTGYLYNKEKTDEALDSEGWLHTGDIGTWTEVIPAGHAEIAVKTGENQNVVIDIVYGSYISEH